MQSRRSRAFAKLFEEGLRLHQSGRAGDAVDRYERAIRVNSQVAEAHNNLGCVLLELGRVDAAAASFARAVELRGDFAAALDNLGLAFERLGRYDEAVALHERATAAEPTTATFFVHLGNALLSLQRNTQAWVAFERAIRLSPQNARAHNGLGAALEQLGRIDEAEASYRAALAIDPQLGDAACNLGKILLDAGDIDAATGWFERALALEPRNARFHAHLVFSRSGSIDERHLEQLERLGAEVDTLPPEQKIELHFALASAYEASGRYDDAFEQLRAGNELKRGKIHYDEAATMRFFATLAGVFTERSLQALRGCGNPATRPVFVFGMPRSGTTLVEQLLAAHPSVHAAGELQVLEHVVRDRLAELWPAASAKVAALSIAEMRSRIRTIGVEYLSATDELAGSAERMTDKLPHNFCLAPVIHLALPNARMIHVRRDPLDTCLSCFATLFANQAVPYSYDLGELARYYRAYERLMAIWRTLLPEGRFIELEYERFVSDFETEARRLVAFCGLPWDSGVLAFHRVQRRVSTASSVQVRAPLYGSAIGRSRRFVTHLGPLLEITHSSS